MSTSLQQQQNNCGGKEARACVHPDKPDGSQIDAERRTTFRQWCERKQQQEDFGHSYTLKKARKRYARAKDVGRHFVQEYDEFSTVFITYCNGVRDAEESIVENAQSFYPRRIVRKRRQILKELDAYEEYAGVSLLAPKSGAEVPHPDAPSGEAYTHAHDFLWIPSTEVSEEDFRPLVEEYNDRVDDYSVSEAVNVETHTSDDVTTPFDCDTDRERGATTSLAQELGRNLPLLDLSYEQGRYDARDAPTYVEKWCAALHLGKDETTDTKGIRRFRTLGRFGELADEIHAKRQAEGSDSEEREVPHPNAPTQEQVQDSTNSKQSPETQDTPKPPETNLSEEEKHFVDSYVAEVGNPSEERIVGAMNNNIGELRRKTEKIRPEVLTNYIQHRLNNSE